MGLASNPMMSEGCLREMTIVRTVLEDMLSAPDKVQYLLLDPTRIRVLCQWVPSHELAFFGALRWRLYDA